jgi:hypothetical protein
LELNHSASGSVYTWFFGSQGFWMHVLGLFSRSLLYVLGLFSRYTWFFGSQGFWTTGRGSKQAGLGFRV